MIKSDLCTTVLVSKTSQHVETEIPVDIMNHLIIFHLNIETGLYF